VTWSIHEVPWPADLPSAVRHWTFGSEFAWLDGRPDGCDAPAWDGCSLIACRPLAVLEKTESNLAVLRVGETTVASRQGFWEAWRRFAGKTRNGSNLQQLRPGWIGYVGFELANELERLPAPRAPAVALPRARLALYDRGIVLDHVRQQALLVRAHGASRSLLGVDYDPDPNALARWYEAAAQRLHFPEFSATVVEDAARATFETAVRRAHQYIAAGDIYQVNLARCIRIGGIKDPLAAYVRLRRGNPAPYAALLSWDGGAIASLSPELFLRLRGADVRTSPIKGTRPRTGDPQRDAAYRAELLASAKEAAELAMIVDLHRNDLGRVCEYGSVQVVEPRRVAVHPTVQHTVADIVGRLRPDRDAVDLLRACFPAGSISGVPKIRALEIIHELEPVARGAYTGAIGVLGLDGNLLCSVAIRIVQMRPPNAALYVGGGIVADSEPAAEYDETCAKAAGILRSLTQPQERGRRSGARSAARADVPWE
jgi:para-aminobenzoate synthetase component I